MCLFTLATAWHDGPIKIHVCPPTGAQVREYVALRGRHPSSDQVPIPSGEEVPQFSPSEPQDSWPQFHLALRDLDDAQLREVLDKIQLETARREGMAPPLRSPLGSWIGGMALWEELMLTWTVGK